MSHLKCFLLGLSLKHQVWFTLIFLCLNEESNLCVLITQKLKVVQGRNFQDCFHFDIKTHIPGMHLQYNEEIMHKYSNKLFGQVCLG